MKMKLGKVNCANSSLYWWKRLRGSFFFSAIFFFALYRDVTFVFGGHVNIDLEFCT